MSWLQTVSVMQTTDVDFYGKRHLLRQWTSWHTNLDCIQYITLYVLIRFFFIQKSSTTLRSWLLLFTFIQRERERERERERVWSLSTSTSLCIVQMQTLSPLLNTVATKHVYCTRWKIQSLAHYVANAGSCGAYITLINDIQYADGIVVLICLQSI